MGKTKAARVPAQKKPEVNAEVERSIGEAMSAIAVLSKVLAEKRGWELLSAQETLEFLIEETRERRPFGTMSITSDTVVDHLGIGPSGRKAMLSVTNAYGATTLNELAAIPLAELLRCPGIGIANCRAIRNSILACDLKAAA